jgi:hypothetical protein
VGEATSILDEIAPSTDEPAPLVQTFEGEEEAVACAYLAEKKARLVGVSEMSFIDCELFACI